jgi:tetraacyldisaccharide 4'-kinase
MKLDSPYLFFKKKNMLFWVCAPVLYILSVFYFLVTLFLKLLYKIRIFPSYKPRCKVISVGNITLGGTGKTPLVEWIVDRLIQNDKNPGIIIRGYKRPKTKKVGIVSKQSGYFDIGDEASMLKENFSDIKIAVGRDKIKSAKELEKVGCKAIVIDDGFQHWRLRRDLDIVTIDCSCPIFNQLLLPLGRLREHLSSLRRADILVLTKTNLSECDFENIKNNFYRINPRLLIIKSIYQPESLHDLKTNQCFPANSDKLKDMQVFILAGIANPIYFDKMISNLNFKIKRELIYPDHYEYKASDVNFIMELAREIRVDAVVTTHKDAVRLKSFINLFKSVNLFYLKVKLEVVEGEKELLARILSVSNS